MSDINPSEVSQVMETHHESSVCDGPATSGAVSRASACTSTGLPAAPTTTISTIAVQSGDTRIVLALLQSGEWLELRVVELTPGLVYLGSTLEEATALQEAHYEVLTKLQSKQSPVEDLLNQADQLISTQKPRAEVYAAMAESLGLAWRDLNAHLETRKALLDMSVTFHTRARQYNDALDAAEKTYTDNVMPADAESARNLLTSLHDHKRAILESSMFTLQEAHALLGRLRSLLQEGGSMDSRPQHIRVNIEFACSQIEHYLETLHDRRRFMDGLFTTRKHHIEQCLALCLLYQDLTEAILNLKQLRDEISEHQNLGVSQANAEILLHEHMRREATAKSQQDQCVRHVKTAERMVETGHYAGAEARARAYSVLEAATALHETCDTRTALLQQSALFFRLSNTAITKLDQAEVQVAATTSESGNNQRLSLVVDVVEEAVQPALTEGYALLEVTGGRGQDHNQGITEMVEQLERRRTRLSALCATSTEEVLQRTELLNSFLEMYNSIESWLVRIGDSFLQGHQDPGGSLSLSKDFLHLHLTLKRDLDDKCKEISALASFFDQIQTELPEDEAVASKQKLQNLVVHWKNIKDILESRISISDKYVKFHEDAEMIQTEFENLESLLKNASSETDNKPIEQKWNEIQKMFIDLQSFGQEFIKGAKQTIDPYLDMNRAILCVESILDNLSKRKLVITDLHSHLHMKISISKELSVLWISYKENIKKMEQEMTNLEDLLCPLLVGDSNNPEGLAVSLESRLAKYVAAVKMVQQDIENMVTKAEGMAHRDDAGVDRPAVVRSLLQLYQNLQNKATDYQILGAMLVQWCRNIAEVHKSCDNLERQFDFPPRDINGAEIQIREHESLKQAVSELLKFAQHEADAIIQKITSQCDHESGSKDITRIKNMLERRRTYVEETWERKQSLLERQLKKSQYEVDLKAINDQLRELSEQLGRMKGHYGDSLNSAINMKNAFNHFKSTVENLQRRIENFVSTAERMLTLDDDNKDIQSELDDLKNKWSSFHLQVGNSQKSINLSIEFFNLVHEAEDWFKKGSQLLVNVAGESSQIKNPEQAEKLRQRIDSFLTPGKTAQADRLSSITSLAFELYGETTPQQVEAVAQQNKYMLDSFNVINQNLVALMDNLKAAELQRSSLEKEQQDLVKSLAIAQAEAESARLRAAAAEEAREAAEEAAEEAREAAEEAAEEAAKMIPIQTSYSVTTEKMDIKIQTEAIPLPPDEEPMEEEEEKKEVKKIEELPQHMPPVFLTPLVGATISEGVKFSFECRVMGYPIPDVVWLKDGLSIMSNPDYQTAFENGNCKLTIEETFTEDSALFTCKAVNASGMAETSATINVKETVPTEPMSPPLFSRKLVDISSKEGASLQLQATVTGHPLPVVTWLKDWKCIDDSPDFVISFNNGECLLRVEELTPNHQGLYECQASNELGEDSTKAKLTVAVPIISEMPWFPIPLSNLMARAGQKFKLECQVSGLPVPELAWLLNSKPVKETPDCKTFFDGTVATLVISEAFPNNAGQYILVATNIAGTAQTSSNVSVKGRIPTETSDSEIPSDIDAEPVKPSVQQPLKDFVANEGESARLDCIIVGQPEPEVIWYHDEKPVKESEDFRLLFHGDRCSLVIQEAFVEDAGRYKVIAMNSAGETSTSCFLSVKTAPEKVPSPEPPVEIAIPVSVAPRFSQLFVDNHEVEGQAVSLKASVTGIPKPTIAWFRDSIPLLPDDQLQIYEEPDDVVVVFIPKTTLDHTGEYEVVASNSVGTAKCIAFLSIEPYLPPRPVQPMETAVPPKFSKLLNDATVQAGDSVTFEAEVTGKPKPLVHWTLNDTLICKQDFSHGRKLYSFGERSPGNFHLTIPLASKLQDGRLCIVAENEAGKAVSACNLHIADPIKVVAPESFEQRTIISETHVTKIISSSVNNEEPTQKTYSASSSSQISSVTGEPTVEVHGSRVQETEQRGTADPIVAQKVNLIKIEDSNVVEQICEDSSTAPYLSKKIVIKRKSTPARFITPLQGVIVQENDRVVFESSIDGFPEPTIQWSHNGGPLPSDSSVSFELNKISLLIPRVNQNHGGRYSCSIDNEAGSAQCTCDLVVKKKQFPPVFSKRLLPSVIEVGERLHLEIDISGTPVPEIQWAKNSQILVSSDRIPIKAEGSRHWLVIPETIESDSGRYSVVGTNSAGRAECLADVLVTKLGLNKPFSQTIVFQDISDDSRNQTEFIAPGHVKTLKDSVEARSLDPQVSLASPINHVNSKLDPSLFPSEEKVQESQISFEKEERKLPGKLRKSWPPLPDEEEIRRIDPNVDITNKKVSSIISTFSSVSESEEPVFPQTFERVKSYPQKELVEEISPQSDLIESYLVKEPEPDYGFIEVVPEPQTLLPVVEDQIEQSLTPLPETDIEKSLTPDVYDTDFSSDYYPKTSPSLELESFGKATSITEELSEKVLEPLSEKEDDMEVKTEKRVSESSFSEVKKSFSTSEKTIVETKIYRNYDDDVHDSVDPTRTVLKKELHEEFSDNKISDEVNVPDTKEFPATEEFQEYPAAFSVKKEAPFEGPFLTKSTKTNESTFHSSINESHSNFSSSTEIKNKTYSSDYQPSMFTDQPVASVAKHSPPSEQITSSPQLSVDHSSARDESSKSPILQQKSKKKRESVRQIALRLEEAIAPLSPEEVPGGIRMFPPKLPTPSVETPKPTFTINEKSNDIQEKTTDEKKEDKTKFPELEPFPFIVEKNEVIERPRPKVPPPTMPKKFVPGNFTDSEYESDYDSSVNEKRFVPKKINFEVKPITLSRTVSVENEPPPPSVFESPLEMDSMRPSIHKKEVKKDIILEKPKEIVPRKKPKVVQKFLAKAGQQAEQEIVSPKPPKSSTIADSKKNIFLNKESIGASIAQPTKPVSLNKMKKSWPPVEAPVNQVPTDQPQQPCNEVLSNKFEHHSETKSSFMSQEISQSSTYSESSTTTSVSQPTREMTQIHPQVKPVAASIIEPPHIPKVDILKEPPQLQVNVKPIVSEAPVKQPIAIPSQQFEVPNPLKEIVVPPKMEQKLPTQKFIPSEPHEGIKLVAPPFSQNNKTIIPAAHSSLSMPPKHKIAPIHKFSSVYSEEKKSVVYSESKTTPVMKSKYPVSSSDSGPPKMIDDLSLKAPWTDIRSQSLERPPVTEAPVLPPMPHEAPPSVYWSSNITMEEKRASLPMSIVQNPPIVSSSTKSLKTMQQLSKSEVHIKKLPEAVPVQRQKQNQIVEGSKYNVQKVKPHTPFRKSTPTPVKLYTKPVEPTITISGYKPIPEPEPFPFEVPKTSFKQKQKGPPPRQPSKFIPGLFTESDYESDYEGSSASVWKPYLSDTDAMSYKPIKVHLKQGRQRRPRVPSPPPPSKFDSPSQILMPLRTAISLTDFAADIPTSKESTPLPIVTELMKKLPTTKFKSVGGKSFITSQPPQVSKKVNIYSKSNSQVKSAEFSPRIVENIRSSSLSPVRNGPVAPPTIAHSTNATMPRVISPKVPQTQLQYQHKIDDYSITSSLPDVSIKPVMIPLICETFPVSQSKVSKPSSPKGKKKTDLTFIKPKEFEESGYAADTEATLPRRIHRSHNQFQSSTFSKTESKSSSSFSHSQSQNFHSQSTSFSSNAQGALTAGNSRRDDINGGPPGSFSIPSFPSFPTPSGSQRMQSSTSFSSSESKSSQVKKSMVSFPFKKM